LAPPKLTPASNQRSSLNPIRFTRPGLEAARPGAPGRTAFRSEGEQQSERSDADTVIVAQVFGIVKRDCPKRSGGGSAGIGVQGKGAAAPLPLLPCCRRKNHGPLQATAGAD